jgi:hypothetical protein
MAGYLSKEENQVHTLGTLLAAGEDKSWKVRLCFAKRFAQFAGAFGKEITDNNLIQTFTQLLSDNEQEVKNAAITSLSACLKNLATEKICNFILPALTKTYSDSSFLFKAGTALALCEMAPLIGKDYTQQRIIPVMQELLKVENSEVRINCIQNYYKIADVLGTDLISPTFLTTITSMTKEEKWRVRYYTVELIGQLSIRFGREVYQKQFESVFIGFLTNSASAVREMGIVQAAAIGKKFGPEWIIGSFIPKVVEAFNHDKQPFNYRITCLLSLSAMIPFLHEDKITEYIVPTLVKACSDKVPNVQFTNAKIIKKNKAAFDQNVLKDALIPKLRENTQEADKDVAYYAKVALDEV